jgi:hypothetical protein
MARYDADQRTRTLARLVGPYLLAMAAALYVRRETLPEFLSAFMQDDALVFIAGAFTLLAGLGLLVAHHHWSSISASLISFIGLAGALKGASLMIAPGFGSEVTDLVVRMPFVMQGAIGFELVVGLWLIFVGYAREHVRFAFAMKP